MHSLVGLSAGLARRRGDCSPWHPGARTRRDAGGRAADRQILEALVASARNSRAAAESGAKRWIRPTLRVIAGRARRVMAPPQCFLSRGAGAGSGGARGPIASRAAVYTAICGVTPACGKRLLEEDAGRGARGTDDHRGLGQLAFPAGVPPPGWIVGEYEQELLLSQWVDGQPLAGEREVRRAKLARAVADQRSYSASAVGVPGPGFDARGRTAPEPPGASPSVR